jgi:iron(III) transport system permease protein
MTLRRLAAAIVLALVAGVPLAEPFLDLLQRPERFEAWSDAARLLSLAENTLLLVAGTLILAMPAGVAAAVLLFRTDLPLRRLWLFVTVLALFVPLPLLTSAWQATLGTGGWLPAALWPYAEGRPWAEGLAPAIWIHALASLPWVIVMVGVGLCWVEGELEDDALLAANGWRVLWHVTLPRSRAAVGAAALWVALQTAAEITVTDMMQVRTFAEEVYTQLGMGGGPALARAVGVSLPFVGLTWLLIVWSVPRLEKRLPPLQTLLTPSRPFSLRWGRPPAAMAMLVCVSLLVGAPLGSLLWKAGLQGWPATWSAAYACDRIGTALRLHGLMVLESLVLAGLVGLVAARAALRLAWLGSGARWFAALVLGLLASAWSLPGPVVGIGFKAAIGHLLDCFGSNPGQPDLLATLLYYGPSPLPIAWVQVVRFLPCAVAMLWPVVRLVPAELRDSARADGLGPGQEYHHVVRPLTARAWWWTALAVAALAIGELSASKLVETPGSQTFSQVVFDRMHYGVTNDVAALCLVLFGMVFVLGLGVVGVQKILRSLTLPARQPDSPEAGQSVHRSPRSEPRPR